MAFFIRILKGRTKDKKEKYSARGESLFVFRKAWKNGRKLSSSIKYILEAGEKLRNFDYIPQQSSLNIPLGVTKR